MKTNFRKGIAMIPLLIGLALIPSVVIVAGSSVDILKHRSVYHKAKKLVDTTAIAGANYFMHGDTRENSEQKALQIASKNPVWGIDINSSDFQFDWYSDKLTVTLQKFDDPSFFLKFLGLHTMEVPQIQSSVQLITEEGLTVSSCNTAALKPLAINEQDLVTNQTLTLTYGYSDTWNYDEKTKFYAIDLFAADESYDLVNRHALFQAEMAENLAEFEAQGCMEDECIAGDVEFEIQGDRIVPNERYGLQITVLGSAITYGAGGADIPVTAKYYIGGQWYEGDKYNLASGNLNNHQVHTFNFGEVFDPSDVISIKAASWENWGYGDVIQGECLTYEQTCTQNCLAYETQITGEECVNGDTCLSSESQVVGQECTQTQNCASWAWETTGYNCSEWWCGSYAQNRGWCGPCSCEQVCTAYEQQCSDIVEDVCTAYNQICSDVTEEVCTSYETSCTQSNTCAVYESTYNDKLIEVDGLSGSQQVVVLRNGDTVPAYIPYGNQAEIETFLADYIDIDGKVTIGESEAIYLFELGSTNQSSSAFDMQDLVVLVTMTSANVVDCEGKATLLGYENGSYSSSQYLDFTELKNGVESFSPNSLAVPKQMAVAILDENQMITGFTTVEVNSINYNDTGVAQTSNFSMNVTVKPIADKVRLISNPETLQAF